MVSKAAWFAVAAAGLLAFAAPSAQAGGDPDAGKKVFNQCRACHSLEAGQHRVGPSLHGIFGRTAGTVEGFNRYSPALKKSDVVWDAETLSSYIEDPKGFIEGNRMPFVGIANDQKRADLIAYLKQAAQ